MIEDMFFCVISIVVGGYFSENILFDVHFGGFFDDSSSEYHLW